MNKTATPNEKIAAGLLAATLALFMVSLLTTSAFGISATVISAQTNDYDMGMPIGILSLGLTLSGILLIPSIYLNIRKILINNESEFFNRNLDDRIVLPVLIILWLASLALGYYAPSLAPADWFLLPLANLGAVTMPIALITRLAVRNLPLETPRRAWNTFSLAFTVGPLLIILAEGLLIFAILAGFLIYFGLSPHLIEQYTTFIAEAERMSQTQLVNIIMRTILTPINILGLFTFISLAVPLIEEILKPIGVWLVGSRTLNPAEGFALGAISGAGYAFFESLGASAAAPNEWLTLVLSRSGTDLLHIFNTALMGWALINAFQHKKYIQLALSFTATVLIHGLWNASAILYGLSEAREIRIFLPAYLKTDIPFLYILGALIILMLALLLVFNYRLQPKITPMTSEYNLSTQPQTNGENE